MTGSILGNAVRRVEDPELLLGQARYIANMTPEGLVHVAFVRSQVAHGLIVGIDTTEARQLPGVLGVWTAPDLDLAKVGGLFPLNPQMDRPPLATDKVRFVGDLIAAVVATSPAVAADAVGLVEVDLEALPAAVDMEEALAEGAPLSFEELGSNLVAGLDTGPEDPLAGAATVVRVRTTSPRMAVVPLEGEAILADPRDDGSGHQLTVWVATQMPHLFATIAAARLGLERHQLRVIAPHVGGGFGAKVGMASEHAVTIAVARQLGRPVRWVQDRSDNMVGMPHGRGQVDYIEMGFAPDATITGMRVRVVADAGAYGGFGGALALGPTRMMAQGPYRIPQIRYAAAAVTTNTTPMGAFRGAGRPEATQMLERAMDLAARELGVDPVEIRRRNLLGAEQFPFTTQMGTTYDSGDYLVSLDKAIELAGYADLRAEQERRLTAGARRVLGIGVATYVEITAGGGTNEYASVEVHADGTATVGVGTSAHGQGHATAFAMIVADRLGIAFEAIRVIESDTAIIPEGGGTGGSRSLQIGGAAAQHAAGEVWETARKLAAELLEASEDDVVVQDGRVGVAGVPARALTWAQLGAAAQERATPLAWAGDVKQVGETFPFGAHIAVVEVDLDTGSVVPIRHVAVDDCGRIINSLIVTGQQHGGIAQGIAQALWENVVFDEDGNPLTSNLADYGIPSAAELPSFESANTQTLTPRNTLGAKGIGESGTIGATPSVHNAVIDALAHLGVRHIDMPCTPERVWRAVRDAEEGRVASPWREPPEVLDSLPRMTGGGPDVPDI